METTAIKGLAIGVLFVLAFIGGIIPLRCIRTDSESLGGTRLTKRIISLLNSAAAGIFLSIALVHLLPDVRMIFEKALNTSTHHAGGEAGPGYEASMPFDWAGFMAGVGFLLVVFVEQLMMWCLEKSEAREMDQLPNDETTLVKAGGADNDVTPDGNYTDYGALRERSRSPSSHSQSNESEAGSHSTTIVRGLDDVRPVTTFRAFILLMSLSLHSVFEGLALGLQLEAQDAIDLLIAISVHKAIESFTVLLRFAQIPGQTLLKWTCLLLFSLASPVGIAIGIPLADPSVNADALLINGILQGLATGTFMFVTFVELLPVELAGKHDRLLKFACLVAGFGLMCGLTQV